MVPSLPKVIWPASSFATLAPVPAIEIVPLVTLTSLKVAVALAAVASILRPWPAFSVSIVSTLALKLASEAAALI